MKEMLRFKLSSLHNNVLIRSRINFSRIEFPDEKLETSLIVIKLINLCRNRLCIYKNLQSVRNKCVLFAINIFISRKVASDFNSDIHVQFVKKSIECYSIVIELVSLISSNYTSHGEQLGYNNNNNNRRQYSIVRIARIESSPRSNFRSIISHFFPTSPPPLVVFSFLPFIQRRCYRARRSCCCCCCCCRRCTRGARIIAAKRSPRFYSRQATRIVNVFGHYSRFC